MSEDWKDIEAELNTPNAAGWYQAKHTAGGKNPCAAGCTKHLNPGQSEEIVVVSAKKIEETREQWAVKDKMGKPLGYTWRFRLQNGKIWDVANKNRTTLLQGLYPTGKEPATPARFKITNVGGVVNKQPSVKVEYVGPAEDTTPVQF